MRKIQNNMASPPCETTSLSSSKIRQDNPAKLDKISENGMANELANDGEEFFSEVFNSETEETLSNSSAENGPVSTTTTSEKEKSITTNRKRSVLKRGGEQRPKPQLQKRVSFSSVPSERRRRVSSAADCFAFMQTGSEFLKLRPGGRQYQRFYQLDQDMEVLYWRPSSKKPEKAILPVDLLYEVRTGKNTILFKEQGHYYSEDCCFSLIVGPNYDSIDLVASDQEEANIWITGLRLLTQKAEENDDEDGEKSDMRRQWLKQQFCIADKQREGHLNEKAFFELLRRLGINAPQQLSKQKFQEYVSVSKCTKPNVINEDDFCDIFIDLTTRQEMYFLLVEYSSNGIYLTTDDLLVFLETEQGVTWAGKEYSLDIINRCEPTEEGRKKQILGLDGLTKYFSEQDANIFDPSHLSVCEDMKRPLSHYFIASSHNTYLLDDQLKGRSSIQGYISSLQRGCRCVELDCWDGQNNEPIVHHGHTLTNKIPFINVLNAINEYAFVTSEYPLILSIENHCSVKMQEVMAQYLTDVFGDLLYTTPVNETMLNLPSPETLIRKIIVKNKKLSRTRSSTSDVMEEEDVPQEEGEGVVEDGMAACSDKSQPKMKRSISTDTNNIKEAMLSQELSDLVNLCKSVRFESFQHSFEKQKCWEICSIGETAARKLCQMCPEEFVSYNKKHLSRIYPAPKRVDSSNYNPVEFWNCGCQIVALNYQYAGLAMDLNRGRFLRNGKCGYTLKPSVMRDEVAYFSPSVKNKIPGISPLTLQVKIISGFQLPKPRGSTSKGDSLDPYVMVELYGLATDCHYERSRTIQHNGYNPVFDETFEFRIILPELALLRFVVLDDDHIGDCFIGQFTIPVDCIRQGYRTVYLLSGTGELLEPASLFIHISFLRDEEVTVKNKGFSIARSLKKKEYTSLKSIGMKVIDDTFKLSINPLREATNLREDFQNSLNAFKDSCGLTPRSNIKQCVRIMNSRINNVTESNPSFKCNINLDNKFPTIQYTGEPSTVLLKVIQSFEELIEQSKKMTSLATEVYDRLLHSRRSAFEWHGDLREKCEQEGFKERRVAKVFEHFSWNIKVLCGQEELLKSTNHRCEESIKQIVDVLKSTNNPNDAQQSS